MRRECNRAGDFVRVIENVANQESQAAEKQQRLLPVRVARFGLRISRAMQPCRLARRDSSVRGKAQAGAGAGAGVGGVLDRCQGTRPACSGANEKSDH